MLRVRSFGGRRGGSDTLLPQAVKHRAEQDGTAASIEPGHAKEKPNAVPRNICAATVQVDLAVRYHGLLQLTETRVELGAGARAGTTFPVSFLVTSSGLIVPQASRTVAGIGTIEMERFGDEAKPCSVRRQADPEVPILRKDTIGNKLDAMRG